MVSKQAFFPEAQKALDDLIAGNRRFVNEITSADISANRRKELLKGQHPIATIVACSDSRVMPGYIFDQGLGNIFLIRTAGEILDDICIASIEYGVAHLGTPLLIILGHTDCGAVKATVSNAKLHGHLPLLADKIKPAMNKCHELGDSSNPDFCQKVILENTLEIAESLMAISKEIKEAVEKNKCIILSAMYDLDSGNVEFLYEVKSHLAETKAKK